MRLKRLWQYWYRLSRCIVYISIARCDNSFDLELWEPSLGFLSGELDGVDILFIWIMRWIQVRCLWGATTWPLPWNRGPKVGRTAHSFLLNLEEDGGMFCRGGHGWGLGLGSGCSSDLGSSCGSALWILDQKARTLQVRGLNAIDSEMQSQTQISQLYCHTQELFPKRVKDLNLKHDWRKYEKIRC